MGSNKGYEMSYWKNNPLLQDAKCQKVLDTYAKKQIETRRKANAVKKLVKLLK